MCLRHSQRYTVNIRAHQRRSGKMEVCMIHIDDLLNNFRSILWDRSFTNPELQPLQTGPFEQLAQFEIELQLTQWALPSISKKIPSKANPLAQPVQTGPLVQVTQFEIVEQVTQPLFASLKNNYPDCSQEPCQSHRMCRWFHRYRSDMKVSCYRVCRYEELWLDNFILETRSSA